MKLKILALAALLGCTASASATLLTFDDLNANLQAITQGYGGFNWDVDTTVGVISTANTSTSGYPGYAKGVVSGANAAFNYGGDTPTTIASLNGVFAFQSAYFTSGSDSQQLTFIGLLNNAELMRSSAIAISADAPRLVQLNWAGIDSLRIVSAAGSSPWVMDNFSYTANVPEPLSLSLMGLGLGVMGVARRRRQRR